MADSSVRGRFVWHELVTPNAAGAREFYTRAVGWTTQSWEQDSAYQMLVSASGPFAGIVESRDAVPQWVPYIGTLDVDATVDAATALGATIAAAAADLPNGGRYAVIADPNGAAFGVHASSAAHAPEKDPEPGDFSWHELATTIDAVEAFGFYRELFGWEELGRHDMGPMGIYVLFGRNGKQLGGIFNKGGAGKAGSAYWLGYVRSQDVDAFTRDVKAARGIVLMEPDAVPGGHRIAQFEDPYGALFAGHTLAADASAAAARETPAAEAEEAPPAAKPREKALAAPRTPAKKAVENAAQKVTDNASATKASAKKRPAAKAPAKKAPSEKIPSKRTPSNKAARRKPARKKAASKAAKPAKKAAAKPATKRARAAKKKAPARPAKKRAAKRSAKPSRTSAPRSSPKSAAKAARKRSKTPARGPAKKTARRAAARRKKLAKRR